MDITEETQATARAVLEMFHTNPALHNQDAWVDVLGERRYDEWGRSLPLADKAIVSEDPNVCNTTLCVAGGVQWVKNGRAGLKKFDDNDAFAEAVVEAGNALGLDTSERYSLFYYADEDEALNVLKALAAGDERRAKKILGAA